MNSKESLTISAYPTRDGKTFVLSVNGQTYEGSRNYISEQLRNYHPKSRLDFDKGLSDGEMRHFTKTLTQATRH